MGRTTQKSIPEIRPVVRILLFNEAQELLLMRLSGQHITLPDPAYNGDYWLPVGGRVEEGETMIDSIARELYEETGLAMSDITLHKEIYYGKFDLKFDTHTIHTEQRIFWATTQNRDVHLGNLSDEEKNVVQGIKWFSMDDLSQSREPIYPAVLHSAIPQILEGNIPSQPSRMNMMLKSPLL